MASRLHWRSRAVIAAAVSLALGSAVGPAVGQQAEPPPEQEEKQEKQGGTPAKSGGERGGPPQPTTPRRGPLENPYTGDEQIPPRPPASDREAYLEWRAKAALILEARKQRDLAQAPKLSFIDGTERQLGSIFDHEMQRLEYAFRNEGGSNLVIRGMKASCGCTVAELDKEVYEPGEEGVITVEFDPLNRLGSQYKYVEIFTNDPNTPAARIRFEADVTQLITISPPFLTMPSVVRGEPEEADVWVFGRTEDFEAELEPAGSRTWLTVEKVGTEEQSFRGERRRGTRFRVKVGDGAPMGRHRVDLNITTNDDRAGGRQMQLIVGVIGDIGYRPLRLNMGRVEPGDVYERTFQVYSRTARPFKLTGASLDGRLGEAGVELQWEAVPLDPESPDVYEVTVRCEVPEIRELTGNIAFRTNRADQPQVAVPYYGQVKIEGQGPNRASGGRSAAPTRTQPPTKPETSAPPPSKPPVTPPPVVPPPARV